MVGLSGSRDGPTLSGGSAFPERRGAISRPTAPTRGCPPGGTPPISRPESPGLIESGRRLMTGAPPLPELELELFLNSEF